MADLLTAAERLEIAAAFGDVVDTFFKKTVTIVTRGGAPRLRAFNEGREGSTVQNSYDITALFLPDKTEGDAESKNSLQGADDDMMGVVYLEVATLAAQSPTLHDGKALIVPNRDSLIIDGKSRDILGVNDVGPDEANFYLVKVHYRNSTDTEDTVTPLLTSLTADDVDALTQSVVSGEEITQIDVTTDQDATIYLFGDEEDELTIERVNARQASITGTLTATKTISIVAIGLSGGVEHLKAELTLSGVAIIVENTDETYQEEVDGILHVLPNITITINDGVTEVVEVTRVAAVNQIIDISSYILRPVLWMNQTTYDAIVTPDASAYYIIDEDLADGVINTIYDA